MIPIYQLLPTIVGIICIGITISHAVAEGEPDVHCLKREEDALLEFKEGLQSPFNRLSSWDPEIDCCKWEGVGCDNTTGHVTSLDLRSSNSLDVLHGDLGSSLLKLPYLSFLDLSGNNFMHLEVPEFLGSLHNLQHLNLSGANLKGVPYHLGNLSRLQSLDLSDNGYSLVVKNFDWLRGLSTLNNLDLSEVDLTHIENWLDVINMLPSLVALRLSACHLAKFPSRLSSSNMTSLETLDLSFNNFHATIPTWLFEIGHTLRHLDLSHSQLKGQIPNNFLENMKSLVFLDLSNNNMSGSIPAILDQTQAHSTLKELHLSSNRLSGTLTEESLACFSELVVLDLSGNNLEGVIMDVHLDKLSSTLNMLDLSSNHLTLNVSNNWVPGFQLRFIGLRHCQLGPAFPEWLRSQNGLLHIDLSDANISDTVPDWFWTLSPKIEYLNLSSNYLGGFVPDLSLNLNLHTLVLTSNNFRGPLPHFPPKLSIVRLNRNSFSGPISHICDILGVNNSLIALSLSSNILSGNIPDCWANGHGLVLLYLHDNSLTGKIPDSFGNLIHLAFLHLGANYLHGEIPNSMKNCTSLIEFFLPLNYISGNIPSWIGDSMQNLRMLNFSTNSIEGNIPLQLCQLKSLYALDLSNNNLSGAIPRCAFDAMTTTEMIPFDVTDPYNSARQSLKLLQEQDQLYEYYLSLIYARSGPGKLLYLSSNFLTGEVPIEITENVGLTELNMSGNQLVGSVPSNIGKMISLRHLDLSGNRLSCAIPTSLADLQNLSYVNFSDNNLSGKIPSSKILDAFNSSSYMGNAHLCGPPLNRTCSSGESYEEPQCRQSEETKEHVEQDADWLEMSSFYISMGLGFVTGFWVFWGSLILNKSWRYTYFRFLSRMNDKIYVTLAVAVAGLQRKFQD